MNRIIMPFLSGCETMVTFFQATLFWKVYQKKITKQFHLAPNTNVSLQLGPEELLRDSHEQFEMDIIKNLCLHISVYETKFMRMK